jgi:hypothetical protein
VLVSLVQRPRRSAIADDAVAVRHLVDHDMVAGADALDTVPDLDDHACGLLRVKPADAGAGHF